MKGSEIVKLLLKRGWNNKGIKGSHYQMENPLTGQKVPIPCHNKDLPAGTLHDILKQVGVKK
jgi:mRNA interferase HicA